MRSQIVATSILSAVALAGGCKDGDDQRSANRERLSRTEFTERVENFFEYDPLRAGRTSAFLIHLTELAEGAPVAGAEVAVRILSGDRVVTESQARRGGVDGIYVAEMMLPDRVDAAACDVEFRIVSETVDETMRLSGFAIE